jgi:AcrR family transcriptional regulator
MLFEWGRMKMPPKAKVSKEDILNVAFNLAKKNGWESINARSIANELGCSTQPIFRIYENMSELKHTLFSYIEKYYNQFIESHLSDKNLFKSIGIAYIDFAKNEPNLFKMLFMSNNYKVNSFMEMVEGEDNIGIINGIAQSTKFSFEMAKRFYVEIWLFTHGIASMIATNSCDLKDNEINDLLNDAYLGFKDQLNKREV